MLSSLVLVGASLATHASAAACSRSFLESATTTYLKAQAAGQPSLLTLSPTVSYAENDTPMEISKGVLASPMTIDYSRSIYDSEACTAFTELNAASSPHPYVIHTRIVFASDSISTIESVVTDDGDWIFNATAHLNYAKQEKWDPIPEAARDTRATLKAAADAYLDQWGNPSHPVPLGTPCARLEGGMYTGTGNQSAANTCLMGAFPSPLKIGNRRYVIDETLGAVSIFNEFPFIEATAEDKAMPSSNLFRVQGGLIRYIHECTVCATRNCGR
ncbi:hypothetical protein B0H66DRAFT_555336 [Apodospora peruviana]|uniref:DUF8021 domain-containing protein n=1 Tax=Apodospora peruviana TaxID=516989 RepID=A0AAE0ICY0_9PEZI|nr:hypothetical protein B0H66DRAFT_555336 [Apodospora peruviana]